MIARKFFVENFVVSNFVIGNYVLTGEEKCSGQKMNLQVEKRMLKTKEMTQNKHKGPLNDFGIRHEMVTST